MPRSLEEILAHADELADAFEAYEPEPEEEGKASSLMALRLAAARRQAQTGHCWRRSSMLDSITSAGLRSAASSVPAAKPRASGTATW